MAWPDLNYAAASESLRGSLPLVSETKSLLELLRAFFAPSCDLKELSTLKHQYSHIVNLK